MKTLLMTTFFLILSVTIIAQWNQISFPTNEDLFMVRFSSETTGWVVGENFVYKTTDGGNNWETQDPVMGGGSEALFAIDSLTAVYADYSAQGIRRTTDGGINWYTAESGNYYYYDINFLNTNLGFVCGTNVTDSLIVRRTTDGGESWNTISYMFVENNFDFEGISFIDSLIGWAVTYRGWVYHTTDAGFNWTFQDSVGISNSPNRAYLPCRDIQFTSPDSGWVVGGVAGESLVARTTDGGQSWTINILYPFSSCSIHEIEMINSQIGWFTGENNGGAMLAETSDGGNSWTDQLPFQVGFKSIAMVNENIGYVVGKLGRIYKTINGGVSGIDNNSGLPKEFSLYQNFPNPFNPVTTIKYQIPNVISTGGRNLFVSLKIYDILGREITTLVNEEKPAGEYEVEFNGTNLPSGIYFYRLQAGNYKETRKMVLLR